MIKPKIHTKEKTDPDFAWFLEQQKKMQNAYVAVGLHEDAGVYTVDHNGHPLTNPPSVVEVGLWNEFGTRFAPERSWLRSTVDENENLLNQWREEMITNMLTKRWTIEKCLEAVGFRLVVLVQNKIKSGVAPVNAASVTAAKVAAGVNPTTLIDTGLMLRSVTFKVFMGDADDD